MRERVAEENRDAEPVPVFNKRLFASHGSVVITAEARKLMARNARARPTGPQQHVPLMSKSELLSMRGVVEGLRLIHRGQDWVKDALSHVLTMETYSAYQYIVKRPNEALLSCYYILHGAVQVTYDMDVTETRNVFQPDIIYNHGTGEFLGLVSPDGLSDDLSPPATVYTTEHSEFLRIDRQKFHAVVKQIGELQRKEKLSFLSMPANPLASLPPEALEKVIPHVHKMDYPPNKTILRQNDSSEYLYFIISGRCQLSRDVYIPEIQRDVCFCLDAREPDDFFAEECILKEGEGSICHVTTTSHTSCFLLHQAALSVVNKDTLQHVLEDRRHHFPPDHELRERGYRKSVWDGYKHHVVSRSLRERGYAHILSRDTPERVRSRPPSAESQQKENLLRFMAKGANYQPVQTARARSAWVRTPSRGSGGGGVGDGGRLPARPRTAAALDSREQRSRVVDPPPPPQDAPGRSTPASSPSPSQRPPSTRVAGRGGDGGRSSVAAASSSSSPPSVQESEEEEEEEEGGGEGEREEEASDVEHNKHDVMTASDDALGGIAVTTSFVRMLEKNLPKGVLQKIIGSSGADMDPRLLGRAMGDNPELGRQLRLAWELHQQEKNDGFTKTTVLVTMKTDDIVRKAKALADKHCHQPAEDGEEDEEGVTLRWNSSLYRENTAARTCIAGDKLRAAFLRKKIRTLQNRRARERAEMVYRSAKPGHVPFSFAELVGSQGREAKRRSVGESFYLDDIQRRYQGLDPEAASRKVNCMGYQVLFVSRLRRRCRSMHDIQDIDSHENEAPSGLLHGSSENSLTPRSDRTQEAPASLRRRSAAEMTSKMTSSCPREAIRKDAPVTIRSLTLTSSVSSADSGVISAPSTSARQQSRDGTLSGETTEGRKRLPYPKLQLNR
ncbi:uncharacterized protein LOC143302116 isoform X2 [Babylonia areolata]